MCWHMHSPQVRNLCSNSSSERQCRNLGQGNRRLWNWTGPGKGKGTGGNNSYNQGELPGWTCHFLDLQQRGTNKQRRTLVLEGNWKLLHKNGKIGHMNSLYDQWIEKPICGNRFRRFSYYVAHSNFSKNENTHRPIAHDNINIFILILAIH